MQGDLLLFQDRLPWDPETGDIIHGTIQEETRAALSNLKLRELGLEKMGTHGSLEDVVKCDVFLSTMKDFDAMNEIYAGIAVRHRMSALGQDQALCWGL